MLGIRLGSGLVLGLRLGCGFKVRISIFIKVRIRVRVRVSASTSTFYPLEYLHPHFPMTSGEHEHKTKYIKCINDSV